MNYTENLAAARLQNDIQRLVGGFYPAIEIRVEYSQLSFAFDIKARLQWQAHAVLMPEVLRDVVDSNIIVEHISREITDSLTNEIQKTLRRARENPDT